MSGTINIVFDYNKHKLRAQAEQGGFVRFPRNLRVEGAKYYVEILREGKSGSWIACGKIERVR